MKTLIPPEYEEIAKEMTTRFRLYGNTIIPLKPLSRRQRIMKRLRDAWLVLTGRATIREDVVYWKVGLLKRAMALIKKLIKYGEEKK